MSALEIVSELAEKMLHSVVPALITHERASLLVALRLADIHLNLPSLTPERRESKDVPYSAEDTFQLEHHAYPTGGEAGREPT